MATVTASSVTTTDSLETFRQQFNTLRSDIQGLSFAGSIVFEGATADDFETTLAVTDPTADRTVTIQDKTGTLAMQGRDINDVVVMDASDGSGTDEAGAILLNASASGVDDGEALLYEDGTGDHIVNPVLQIAGNFVFEGATVDAFETTLAITDPTADQTITLQNKTGTVALQGRDIDDIIVLNGTDAAGANEASAIILDGDATSVVGVVVNVGEALLYEEGVNDHILNPTFEGVEEFIILEESLEGTPSFVLKENVDSSSLNARFAYQPATSDNLLGSLFIPPAAGGVQFTTPVSDGNANQVFSTDGAGNLQFVNQSSGLSLNNDANNRVITATGSNSGNGEANLLFDGSTLTVTGNITVPDAGTIGSVSDTDAIAIAANGVVTFSAGIAGTLSTAAQTNITSVGTLTALTVDDVVINGKVVTITGDTDDTFTITTGAHGATTLATVDTAATAGNLTLDIDGGIVLDAASNGAVTLKNSGTSYGSIFATGNNLNIKSQVNNEDIVFRGLDDSSDITALTLDMSENGKATFLDDVTVGDDLRLATDSSVIYFGADTEIALIHNHNVGLKMASTAYAPLARRGEDVFIVLDQTAAAGTDAGDNVIMDRSASDGTDAGDDIIGEDEVFLHSGMQRNVIEIRSSGGRLLNSLAGFAPGAI
jgi:hypothetical protein